MLAIILYIRPCKMHVLFFQRATLALILKYNTDRGWWLLVEMMTKCFSCISITIADTGGKQMQILVGVFLFYGTMLANSFPYRFARHMYSDTAFTICKVMVLCMAVSCIAGDSTDGTPILFVVWLHTLTLVSWLYTVFSLSSKAKLQIHNGIGISLSRCCAWSKKCSGFRNNTQSQNWSLDWTVLPHGGRHQIFLR